MQPGALARRRSTDAARCPRRTHAPTRRRRRGRPDAAAQTHHRSRSPCPCPRAATPGPVGGTPVGICAYPSPYVWVKIFWACSFLVAHACWLYTGLFTGFGCVSLRVAVALEGVGCRAVRGVSVPALRATERSEGGSLFASFVATWGFQLPPRFLHMASARVAVAKRFSRHPFSIELSNPLTYRWLHSGVS